MINSSNNLRVWVNDNPKKHLSIYLALLLALTFSTPVWAEKIDVCFTPGGPCTATIVQALNSAKASIFVQAYSFTSAPIAKALVEAHKRGVHVEVILDRSNLSGKYSSADFISHMGIPTFVDSEHAIAHNKIMVIDGLLVITGSFNFTKAAQEKNAENLLVIQDKALADKYIDNWEAHKKHSAPYIGKEEGALPKKGRRR